MEHKDSDCTIEITIVHSFKLVNNVLKITLLVKFVFPLAPIALLTVAGNKMTSHTHALLSAQTLCYMTIACQVKSQLKSMGSPSFGKQCSPMTQGTSNGYFALLAGCCCTAQCQCGYHHCVQQRSIPEASGDG